jgi:hypothetical protein
MHKIKFLNLRKAKKVNNGGLMNIFSDYKENVLW